MQIRIPNRAVSGDEEEEEVGSGDRRNGGDRRGMKDGRNGRATGSCYGDER